MSVQAKFYVAELAQTGAEQKKITMRPVTRGEENKTWAKWTPGGEITLYVNNPDAAAQFVWGTEYLITFEQVDKPDLPD